MRTTSMLFRGTGLRVEALEIAEDRITVVLTARKTRAPCPSCGDASRRVHSHYTRRVSDVGWCGVGVVCRLAVRRFRCGRNARLQRIFCERLDSFAGPHARRTGRLRALLQEVGLAMGGRPGERLLPVLRVPASRTTLLRLVRATRIDVGSVGTDDDGGVTAVGAAATAPRVLGVDEWAFRRGPRERRFGTILLDLERHRPVDLLRDATADGFAPWLRAHPGAEVISRDRGGAFADGARLGAPEAVQVADRFHLLRNLGDATKRVLQRHASAMRVIPSPRPQGGGDGPRAPASQPMRTGRHASRERVRREMRERHAAIQDLVGNGMSISATARALGVHRHTVQKYLPLPAPPERRYTRRRPTILAPHERYLLERWRQQGRQAPAHAKRRRNALALWRELRQRGFPGAYGVVARAVAHWNRLERAGESVPAPLPGLTPRHATALLLLRSHRRTADEQRAVDAVRVLHHEVETALTLFDGFAELIREVRQDTTAANPAALREDRLARLDRWLSAATQSGVTEVRAFGIRLRQDLAAVQAALTSPYSQGQTEGHITRLKLLRRQMYGRANFDLLRLRFLAAHPI